jgi:hypothetical protein
MGMNDFQRLWWRQAKSDHDIFVLLRDTGVSACHQLHYLQMATEKLAKAYFWRTGSPPWKSHVGLRQFLLRLATARTSERQRIVEALAFKRFDDFQAWNRAIAPLAYGLERLAPALAQCDGPNPEYPWPHSAPTQAPVDYEFQVWKDLTETGRGRQLQQVIADAMRRFPTYA